MDQAPARIDRQLAEQPFHRALAGHLHWRGLRELQSVLQHRGVTLAMSPADSLAAALVTRYLDVKRRQAL